MAGRSLYTKKLGGVVAKNANAVFLSGRYHVISGVSEKWAVVSEGRIRPVRTFLTREEAVSFAKKNAQRTTGEVVIHGKTGQIKDTISYVK